MCFCSAQQARVFFFFFFLLRLHGLVCELSPLYNFASRTRPAWEGGHPSTVFDIKWEMPLFPLWSHILGPPEGRRWYCFCAVFGGDWSRTNCHITRCSVYTASLRKRCQEIAADLLPHARKDGLNISRCTCTVSISTRFSGQLPRLCKLLHGCDGRMF